MPNFALPRHLFAGGDIFLMPSQFEPCGVAQMEAMRYGNVPVVRRVGGLNDTVKDFNPETVQGNGFVFQNFEKMALFAALIRALETYRHGEVWQSLMKKCMETDFSWSSSAKKYSSLYEKAIALKAAEKKKLPVVYREDLA
jgi:starch synthase